jgi:hypothetical protein
MRLVASVEDGGEVTCGVQDRNTGVGRSFAFIDFYNHDDAAKAIEELNGTGFDSLILNVDWARKSSSSSRGRAAAATAAAAAEAAAAATPAAVRAHEDGCMIQEEEQGGDWLDEAHV